MLSFVLAWLFGLATLFLIVCIRAAQPWFNEQNA